MKGVDLMYHEATYGNDLDVLAKSTFHSTAADAAQCAKDACAGKLVIGDILPVTEAWKFF